MDSRFTAAARCVNWSWGAAARAFSTVHPGAIYLHLGRSYEVSELLGVSAKTVYRWVKDGRLPAYRLGQQLRFNRSELLEWATAPTIHVSPEIFAEPESEAGSFAPSLKRGW